MAEFNWKTLNKLIFIILTVVTISWAWWISPRPGFSESQLQSIGGDFTLYSINGPVSLQSFRGKVVLIYIGYTQCPDICPTTLKNWADALNSFDQNTREQTQGLFISIDPQRDTLRWLDKYTRYFHRGILGLSGSFSELSRVTSMYRVNYSIQPADQIDYNISHSAFVYVVNPRGKVHSLLFHDSGVEQITSTIQSALAST